MSLMYNQVLDLVSHYPASPVKEIVLRMLRDNDQKRDALLEECLNIVADYADYQTQKAGGWGWEISHKHYVSSLSRLAQKSEIHTRRYREDLRLLRSCVQDDGEVGERYAISYPKAFAEKFGDPVDIDYIPEKEVLRIEISGMLPFALKDGASYHLGKLDLFLKEYQKKWYGEKGCEISLSPAAVVFVHHYDRNVSWHNYVRDYDNQERRGIINTLQNSSILSDNPTRMIDMNMAVSDERTFTEILITTVMRYPELLKELDFSVYLRGKKQADRQAEAR